MKEYLNQLLEDGAFVAVEMPAWKIVTAPWVVMKCRYGCPRYSHNRSCPPFAPDWRSTREILDSYNRAIIFGVRTMAEGTPLALATLRRLGNAGYYKAIGFGTGPCCRCKECNVAECPTPAEVLPSPEACGIDVVGTVRRAGLHIDMPPKPGKELSCYAIILVD
ncbi:MAG: DUF2284 domain-containing protein [Muribaculaceae bacterium]|nr:DUF2284 domain-containing protein [Muribaculaceae bacterium]